MTHEKPGRGVMEKLGFPAGEEHLERDVDAMMKVFVSSGRDSTELAFEAINVLAAHRWCNAGTPEKEFGGVDPAESVAVPWWALYAITAGWQRYREENYRSMEEAFGLKGPRGRGSHRVPKVRRTESQLRGLALETAWKVERDGLSVEKALYEVSERFNASYDTARRAWKLFGAMARKAVGKVKSS